MVRWRDVSSYPCPAVTVDCVVFGIADIGLSLLLIERKRAPHAGMWAIPGGFVEMEEPLDTAARRELEEETGLADVEVEQLHTFGDVDRDPRGRVISVAYWALVPVASSRVQAGDDARQVRWFPIEALPPLAFDHAEIVSLAAERLQARLRAETA